MWNLEKCYRWSYLQSRNRDTDIENKYIDIMVGTGKWNELRDWDWHMGVCVCVMRTYCIAHGTLLNDLWWPKWEGNLERENICMHIADSLCCSVETNNTVSNCTLIQFFKRPYLYLGSSFDYDFVSHNSLFHSLHTRHTEPLVMPAA